MSWIGQSARRVEDAIPGAVVRGGPLTAAAVLSLLSAARQPAG